MLNDHLPVAEIDFLSLGGEGLLRQLKGASWPISQKLHVANRLWNEEFDWIPKKQRVLHEWIRLTMLKSVDSTHRWFETVLLREDSWSFLSMTLEYFKFRQDEALINLNVTSLVPCFVAFFKKWSELDPTLLNQPNSSTALSLFRQVVHSMELLMFSFDTMFKPTLENLGSLVEQILLGCCRGDRLDLGMEYSELLLNLSHWLLKKWNTEIPQYKNTKKVFLLIVHRFLGPMNRLKVLEFLGDRQLEVLCHQALGELFASHYFKEYQASLARQFDWSVVGPEDLQKSHPNYIRDLFSCIETALEKDDADLVASLHGLPTLLKLGLENFKSISSYELFEGKERKQEIVNSVSFSLYIELMKLIHGSNRIRLSSRLKPLVYAIFQEMLHILIEQNIYQPMNEDSSKQRIRFFTEFFRTYILSECSEREELEMTSITPIIIDLVQLDHRILEEFLDRILGYYLMVSSDSSVQVLSSFVIIYVKLRQFDVLNTKILDAIKILQVRATLPNDSSTLMSKLEGSIKETLKTLPNVQWLPLLTQFSDNLENFYSTSMSMMGNLTSEEEIRFQVFSKYWIMFLKCTSRKQLELSRKQIESTLSSLKMHLIQQSSFSISNNPMLRTALYLWVNLVDAFGLGFEKNSIIHSLVHQMISSGTTVIEKSFTIRLVRWFLRMPSIPISTEIYEKLIETFWNYVHQSLLIPGWSDPFQDYHLIQGVSDAVVLKTYTLDTLFHGFKQLVSPIVSKSSLCNLVAKSIITACMGTGFMQTLAWSLLRNEIIFELVGLTEHISKNCLDYLKSLSDRSSVRISGTLLIDFIQLVNILSTTVNRKSENQHLSDLLTSLSELESSLGSDHHLSNTARSKFYMYLYVLVTNGFCPPVLFPRFVHLEKLIMSGDTSVDLVRMSSLSRQIARAWLLEIINTGTDLYLYPTMEDYLDTEPHSDLRLDLLRIILVSLENIFEENNQIEVPNIPRDLKEFVQKEIDAMYRQSIPEQASNFTTEMRIEISNSLLQLSTREGFFSSSIVSSIVRDWIVVFTRHSSKLKTSNESLDIMLKLACSCHGYQDLPSKIPIDRLNLLVVHLFHLKRSHSELSNEEMTLFDGFLRRLEHVDFLKLLRLLQTIPNDQEYPTPLNRKIASVHLLLLSLSARRLRDKFQVPQRELEQLCSLLSIWIYETSSHYQLKKLILAVYLKLVQERVVSHQMLSLILGALFTMMKSKVFDKDLHRSTNFDDDLFHQIYLILHRTLKTYGSTMYHFIPQWIHLSRGLMASLFLTNEDPDNNPYKKKSAGFPISFAVPLFCFRDQISDLTKSATNLSRLLESFSDLDKMFSKHAPYLLSDFIHLQKSSPLPPSILSSLMPGIYAIFKTCSEHEFELINLWQDESGKVLFKTFYGDYMKYFKFKGKM